MDPWKIAQLAWSALVAVLVYLARKALSRLDRIERHAVMKEDFNRSIEEIRMERKAMHLENREILERIEGKIDVAAQATLMEKVRNIEEKLERTTVYTEELKHQYVDPYIREVERLKALVESKRRIP